MKKIYYPVLALFCFLLLANETSAQTYGGFRLGLNSARIAMADMDGKKVDDEGEVPLLGFHIGFLFDYTFESGFAIEAGLLGGIKGAKSVMETDFLGTEIKTTARTGIFYFDVPVNAMYKLEFDPLTIFAQAGPYVGVALAGASHVQVEADDEKEEDSNKLKFGNDEDANIKRLDMGLQFGAGIQISKFLLGVYYQLGMANLMPGEDLESAYMKHRVLQVSIGAKIGNK